MADEKVAPAESTNGEAPEVEDTQWKTDDFRKKIQTKIQEVMDSTDIPVPKTSAELEEQIFGKASKREEYLALAARIILHIRDLKPKEPSPPLIENETAETISNES